MGGSGGGEGTWQRRKPQNGGVDGNKEVTGQQARQGTSAAARTGSSDPCDIVDEGNIRSPTPILVSSLRPGSRLKVELKDVKSMTIIVAKLQNGSEIGTIDCLEEGEIIACILSGNVYEAVVAKKQAGIIVVSIRRTTS